MFKYERTERIMEILKKYKYTTVDFLVRELHYSPATVRRDLTYLESSGLVKKSYGGVSINEYAKPVIIREHENTDIKTKIAKRAAELIKDYDSVFIDGTTTTYFMADFLKNKNNITVTTSNLKLATYLGENNINCYVTGGKVADINMLAGSYAVDMMNKMSFDIGFFSVSAISDDGEISCYGETFLNIIHTAIQRSKVSVCLCDSTKLGIRKMLCFETLKNVDYVISNGEFSPQLIEKFPDTEFITIN